MIRCFASTANTPSTVWYRMSSNVGIIEPLICNYALKLILYARIIKEPEGSLITR